MGRLRFQGVALRFRIRPRWGRALVVMPQAYSIHKQEAPEGATTNERLHAIREQKLLVAWKLRQNGNEILQKIIRQGKHVFFLIHIILFRKKIFEALAKLA